MARHHSLTIETFLAVAEMIAAQLRIKQADRWTPAICQLKFVSFTTEFPEVNDPQFLWAAEQWLQTTGSKDFLRYPTWRELMSCLYRSENGLANRSWGFKESLPAMCAPTSEQQRLLPPRPGSICAPPDQANASAYATFQAARPPQLPPAESGTGLTPRKWAQYLKTLAEEAADGTSVQQGIPEKDPGIRSAQRQVVRDAVQHDGARASPA